MARRSRALSVRAVIRNYMVTVADPHNTDTAAHSAKHIPFDWSGTLDQSGATGPSYLFVAAAFRLRRPRGMRSNLPGLDRR